MGHDAMSDASRQLQGVPLLTDMSGLESVKSCADLLSCRSPESAILMVRT